MDANGHRFLGEMNRLTQEGAKMDKYTAAGVGSQVYCSSSIDYHVRVVYRDRDSHTYGGEFHINSHCIHYGKGTRFGRMCEPKYLMNQFMVMLAAKWRAGELVFYEYKKVGNDLVKRYENLRYHDPERFQSLVEGF